MSDNTYSTYMKMDRLMSPADNYAAYREELKQCLAKEKRKPILPYIGACCAKTIPFYQWSRFMCGRCHVINKNVLAVVANGL